jgi:leader peptidase (prepilin peptidase) / N-methyltransferase
MRGVDPYAEKRRASDVFARLANMQLYVAVFMLIGAMLSILLVSGRQGLFGCALAILMIAIAANDARYFRIPDSLTMLTFLVGCLCTAVDAAPDKIGETLIFAAFRSVGFALPFLGLREFYLRVRGRDALGFGDVKLAAAGGVWLDWFTMPIAIEIAALCALSFYVVKQSIKGQQVRMTARLPFGLFFAPAIWIAWLLEAAYW